MTATKKRGLTLTACAVSVVRQATREEAESELVERIKRLAAKRGVRWYFSGEVVEALRVARRYQ